jgi:hypothetical protein
MMRRSGLLFILAALMAFAMARDARGQAIAVAQLNGTITDPSGATVAGAKVTLRNTGTNATSTTTTNSSGFYAVANLVPGDYELTVSRAGFADYTQSFVLTVGQFANINVKLQLASQGARVVVSTEVPTIEPTKTEVSRVVQSRQITALPTSTRLFTDFALLTPGVSRSRTSLGTTVTEFETTQISFGGMRSFSNEITVDGADFVNEVTGVQRSTPPQDSVQEFRVVNNSFGAEYGRTIGGIVNVVTKSGTNNLHGAAYEYFENTIFNARSLLQPAPLPDVWRQNQFGGELGGPIKKDKTFFFFNYEGHRDAYSPTFAPDLYNNINNIDTAKAYMGLAPEGGKFGFAGLQSTLRTVNNDYGFVRIDEQINPNNRFSVFYNVEDARDLNELVGLTEDGGGIGTPSGGRDLFVRDQSVVGTLNTIISPSVVNTAQLQYARRHYAFPGATGQPDLSIVNDLELGHNFGSYDAIYETRFEASDSMSWVHGNHITKFGFDGNYLWDQNNYPGFTPERILFPNLDCMYAFANAVNALNTGTDGTLPTGNCPLNPAADGVSFLYQGIALPRANCPDVNTPCANGFYNGYIPQPPTGAGFNGGWPSATPTQFTSNYNFHLNHGYWGVFAQDQWRITPTLTFNYGLRWDFESGLGYAVNSYYKAFQPRVGIAWSPDSKTVIRGGYGLYFDRNNMTFFFVTGNQKTIPGYFCGNGATPASCAAAGVGPVTVPMLNSRAASGGWQLGGAPGYPGTPAPPCSLLGLPNCPSSGTISIAALTAYATMAGAPYGPETLTGPCTLGLGGAPTGACGVGSGGIQKNSGLPYANQISAEIDRQLGGGFTLDVAYLHVDAHNLVRGNNINVPCPLGTTKSGNPYYAQGWLDPSGSLTNCTGTPTLGPLNIGPIFGTLANPSGLEFGVPSQANPAPTISAGLLDYNNNVATARYNGLIVSGIEHLGKYFTLNANYTYSHTIDNGNFTTFINLPPNQFDYAAEEANSNQDLRHSFVANFVATTPKDHWYRNFTISSIITLQSGSPFTLFPGSNVLGDLAGLSTDRVGGPPVKTVKCTSVQNCQTLVPRNTYIGAPLYEWDLHIGRYFQLRNNMRLNLAADAFNLLNRANVQQVNSIYGSPVFCGANPVIPQHYNDATTLAIQQGAVSCGTQQTALAAGNWLGIGALPVPVPNTPNPVFGTPREMFNPRQFQFSARLTF